MSGRSCGAVCRSLSLAAATTLLAARTAVVIISQSIDAHNWLHLNNAMYASHGDQLLWTSQPQS